MASKLATARPPAPAELEVLKKLLAQQLTHYQAHKDDAGKLLAVGESNGQGAVRSGGAGGLHAGGQRADEPGRDDHEGMTPDSV